MLKEISFMEMKRDMENKRYVEMKTNCFKLHVSPSSIIKINLDKFDK